MDFQIFKEKKVRSIYRVISTKRYNGPTKTIGTFINSIESGDILLIEFPMFIESRRAGGPSSFNIKIFNLRTSKSLSMKSTELYSKVFTWLTDVEEIDML